MLVVCCDWLGVAGLAFDKNRLSRDLRGTHCNCIEKAGFFSSFFVIGRDPKIG